MLCIDLKDDKIIPFQQDSKIPLDMLSFLENIDYSIDRAKKLYKSSKIYIDLKKHCKKHLKIEI